MVEDDINIVLTFGRSTRSHRAPPGWLYTHGNTQSERTVPALSPGHGFCTRNNYCFIVTVELALEVG